MVTDLRASKLFQLLRQNESVAAISRSLKMSEKTVRKYRDGEQLPSQIERPERSYRTRQDPLAEFWSEIETLLEHDSKLKPYAILDWLKQKYNPAEGEPRVTDSLRRTLERRVQDWKLKHGVEQDVKFTQVHHAGDVFAFDFVVMNALGVTVGGKAFDHMMFHAVFTYSNWEYIHLCHSESFEALAAGLQDALHHAGGVPRRVRSDSLSAAVKNLSSDKEFASQYSGLLNHYGVKGHRINVRKPHENGDVESSHGHFKDALDQALRLRMSRDFSSVDEYMEFVRPLVSRRNVVRENRFAEERAALAPLPAQRLDTCTTISLTVKSDSIIRVKRNAYSVSSKYVGLRMEVRIHQDHLELWYRNQRMERMPRQFGYGKEAIDFRHVIDSLVRKPGAFVNYKYVNHMYPTTRFRMAYDQLVKTTTDASAVKQYLKLLYAAKHEGLDVVDDTLRWFFSTGKTIKAVDVLEVVASKQQLPAPTDVDVDAPDLLAFDSLLQCKDVYDAQETNNHFSHIENAGDSDDAGLADYDRHAEVSGATEGAAAADVPRESPDDGRASGTQRLDAHEVPDGAGREGMSGENPESGRALDAKCSSLGRQDVGPVRLVSLTAACDSAIRNASQWGLLESPGQLANFRQAWFGKNDALIGTWRSACETRPVGLLLDLPDVGSGITACQEGSATGTADQETTQIRSADHRRSGLRSTEPGRNGSTIHSLVRAIREGQPAREFESPVLEMGADIQGSDDDRSSDRPNDSSLGDHRTQPSQLSPRGGQEEKGQANTFKGWIKTVVGRFSHGLSNCR
jgi:transposase